MHRTYNLAKSAIAQGRTVLVYKGITTRKVKHVTTLDRLAFIGGVMFCDGVSCKGFTVAVRPEKWNGK